MFKRLMSSVAQGPVKLSIESKLRAQLAPLHLDIINDSHKHNVPRDSETHFSVVVVSEKFNNISGIHIYYIIFI